MTTYTLPRRQSIAIERTVLTIFAVLLIVGSLVFGMAKVSWRVVEARNGAVVGNGSITYRLKLNGRCQGGRLETTLRVTNSLGSTIFETGPKEFKCGPADRKELARLLREWVDKFLKDRHLVFLRENSHKFVEKFLGELKLLPLDSP